MARFVRGTDGLFKSGSGSKAEPCARECQTFVNEIAVGTVIADRPYSTLLRATRVDIKVMQELLRRASSRVTMDTYTQAVTAQKRRAQSGVIRLFRVRAMVPATEV